MKNIFVYFINKGYYFNEFYLCVYIVFINMYIKIYEHMNEEQVLNAVNNIYSQKIIR